MPKFLHPDTVKGRGAPANAVPLRFNLKERIADGDWLDERDALDGGVRPLKTTVTEEFPKSILSFNSSPDLPFDRSVNAYRGCEHGCVYCYARPSHAYHDLSPGLDFESKLFAKPGAADLLRKTLAKPGYKPATIAIGTNTDPYQPIERTYRITRGILQVCLETRHPIVITTKSARVLEDIDLLVDLAKLGLTGVCTICYVARPQAGGNTGTACICARQTAGCGAQAFGGWRLCARQHRTNYSRHYRSRDRSHCGGSSRTRGFRRFLDSGAVATRTRATFPRLARCSLSPTAPTRS